MGRNDFALRDLVALTLIDGIGPVTCRNLIELSGSASGILFEKESHLAKIKGIGPGISKKITSSETLRKADGIIEYCDRNGIRIHSCRDDSYPRMLKTIHSAPLLLYQKGNVDLNEKISVGIVGTRKPSEYGRQVACRLGEYFSEVGFCVVSGLAYGIDMCVHESVLKSGGSTLAVLGHGVDQIYPKAHSRAADKMLELGGWITEFIPGTKPEARNFPARNRIISGISRALIVVEAKSRGGALITARQAFEQDRNVYAVPGPLGAVTSEGCNLLIRDQVAKLLYSGEDVILDMDVRLNYNLDNRTMIHHDIRHKTDSSIQDKQPLPQAVTRTGDKRKKKLKLVDSVSQSREPMRIAGKASSRIIREGKMGRALVGAYGVVSEGSRAEFVSSGINPGSDQVEFEKFGNGFEQIRVPHPVSGEDLFKNLATKEEIEKVFSKRNSPYLDELSSLMEKEMLEEVTFGPGNALVHAE